MLIRAPAPSNDFLGFVSDKSLLEWFTANAQCSSSLGAYASIPLSNLALPSLYLYTSVIATKASDTVLDAMRLMSDYGVSSIAVIEEEGGRLLSAVSVTDIGKVRSHSRLPGRFCRGKYRAASLLLPDCRALAEQPDTIHPFTPIHLFDQGTCYNSMSRAYQDVSTFHQEPDGSTDGVDKYPGVCMTDSTRKWQRDADTLPSLQCHTK